MLHFPDIFYYHSQVWGKDPFRHERVFYCTFYSTITFPCTNLFSPPSFWFPRLLFLHSRRHLQLAISSLEFQSLHHPVGVWQDMAFILTYSLISHLTEKKKPRIQEWLKSKLVFTWIFLCTNWMSRSSLSWLNTSLSPPTHNPTIAFAPSVLTQIKGSKSLLAKLVMFQLFHWPCVFHNVPGCKEAIIKVVRLWV